LDTEKGIILLDVRTRDEYLEKHIPKSTLIPVDVLANKASRKLPNKNAEIMVYCKSGSRSSMAVKTLSKLGYMNIYILGGIVRWPYETVSGNRLENTMGAFINMRDSFLELHYHFRESLLMNLKKISRKERL